MTHRKEAADPITGGVRPPPAIRAKLGVREEQPPSKASTEPRRSKTAKGKQ